MKPTVLELCAGGGGQAIGLEMAGFEPVALIENDFHACQTLTMNRPNWPVVHRDLCDFAELTAFKGVDLLSGGLPCPPFSIAGKQLGELDERNLFSIALRYVDEIRPKAVMFENVKGILSPRFDEYRARLDSRFWKMGYRSSWQILNACQFGVPQLRPRAVFVAVRRSRSEHFVWPSGRRTTKTVGSTLFSLMTRRGWRLAEEWRSKASSIAPTIVGGSKKHGGPDLGPTRTKRAWQLIHVNAHKIGDAEPDPDFIGMPLLTTEMVARIQGFPKSWHFCGTKTQKYRQIGNAFPPPFAYRIAESVMPCI
jgi:DNA (cytosine-5)-methyltransferase 1